MQVAAQEEARLLDLYEKLPPTSRREVFDFVDYLAHRSDDKTMFPRKSIEEVAGCLPYHGTAKTTQEMDDAIADGVRQQWKK